MVQEQYVSFRTAELLKNKGFKEIVQSLWIGDSEDDEYKYISTEHIVPDDYNSCGTALYSAPTQQMAMRWLREEHDLFIGILHSCTTDKFGFMVSTHIQSRDKSLYGIDNQDFDTYEQAVEAAIQHCLENLI